MCRGAPFRWYWWLETPLHDLITTLWASRWLNWAWLLKPITYESTRAQLLLKCSLLTLLLVECLIDTIGERWSNHLAQSARFVISDFDDSLAELLGTFCHRVDHSMPSNGFIFYDGGASLTAERGSSHCWRLRRWNHFAVLHLVDKHSLLLSVRCSELLRLGRYILCFVVTGNKFRLRTAS